MGKRTAEVVIAEIGVDMTRFPSASHLASWAGLCPGNHESAGKRRSGRARKGNAALRVALCEAAWAGVRKNDDYLGAQFRRFQRRFGRRAEGKAIFACAHSLVVMVWHVLAEEGAVYEDLGADWFERRADTTAQHPSARPSAREAWPPPDPRPRSLSVCYEGRGRAITPTRLRTPRSVGCRDYFVCQRH